LRGATAHGPAVGRLPLTLRLANKLLRVAALDGNPRNLYVDMAWFAPGRTAAAHELWQWVRWDWREQGTAVVAIYDPRSPVRDMLRLPAWLSAISFTLALRGVRALSPQRLLDPPIDASLIAGPGRRAVCVATCGDHCRRPAKGSL